MAKKIMGIDYGEARTGIAVSDALGFLANGVGNIEERDINRLINKIAEKASELSVEMLVIGNPVNMNGTLGPKAEKVAKLAERLREKTGLPVVLFDERCTTMAAHKFLNETNTRGKKRKGVVDTLSAQIILQNYMDSNRSL
ncbi:MAG: Holliday junction resolvase RuvX [Ruminococcaceae bacterium]|nr:Holliday junction resolvase RuvX [Oscillospiraceae bacterium]